MGVKGLTSLVRDNMKDSVTILTERYGTCTCLNIVLKNLILLLMERMSRNVSIIAKLIVVWHIATILLNSIIRQ